MELHDRIIQWRKGNGFSQTRMAEILGITQGHYSKIERGTAEVTGSLMQKIVSLLGNGPDTLSDAEEIPDFELDQVQYFYENSLLDEMAKKIETLRNEYQTLSLQNDKMLKLTIWECILKIDQHRATTAINGLRTIEEHVEVWGEPSTKIMFDIARGYAWVRVGQLEKALDLFSKAHQLLNQMEPRQEVHLRLHTLWHLASLRASQGKVDDARRYLFDFEKVIDPELNRLLQQKGNAIFAKGNLLMYRGRYSEAIKPFMEAISLWKLSNNIAEQLTAYNNIGACYERIGDLEMYRKYYGLIYSLGKRYPQYLFWEVKEALERDGYIF